MIQSLKIVTPIAVALAITACSSNEGSLIAPATATQGTVPAQPSVGLSPNHKRAHTATTATYIYVSNQGINSNGDTLLVYPAGVVNPAPIASHVLGVGTLPKGVATDHEGNVYVVLEHTSTVDVFSRGGGSLKYAITNGVSGPFGVTVDSNDNLYVGNIGGNHISVYSHGSKTPFATITDFPTGFILAGGLVTDTSGNVYADESTHAGAVVEVCTPVTGVGIPTCSLLGAPIVAAAQGGIAFDALGDLAVGGATLLTYYAPPSWQEVSHTTYPNAVEYLTEGPDEGLYIPLNGNNGNGSVVVIPATGTHQYSITNGDNYPWGAASGI